MKFEIPSRTIHFDESFNPFDGFEKKEGWKDCDFYHRIAIIAGDEREDEEVIKNLGSLLYDSFIDDQISLGKKLTLMRWWSQPYIWPMGDDDGAKQIGWSAYCKREKEE